MTRSETTFFTAEPMALIPTDLIIRNFPASIQIGENWLATFQLVEAATAKGVYNKRIILAVEKPGGGTYKGEGMTDVNGMVTINVPGSWIDQEGNYSFYGEFLGDAEYAGCEEEPQKTLGVGVFEW